MNTHLVDIFGSQPRPNATGPRTLASLGKSRGEPVPRSRDTCGRDRFGKDGGLCTNHPRDAPEDIHSIALRGSRNVVIHNDIPIVHRTLRSTTTDPDLFPSQRTSVNSVDSRTFDVDHRASDLICRCRLERTWTSTSTAPGHPWPWPRTGHRRETCYEPRSR